MLVTDTDLHANLTSTLIPTLMPSLVKKFQGWVRSQAWEKGRDGAKGEPTENMWKRGRVRKRERGRSLKAEGLKKKIGFNIQLQ